MVPRVPEVPWVPRVPQVPEVPVVPRVPEVNSYGPGKPRHSAGISYVRTDVLKRMCRNNVENAAMPP